MAGLIFMDWKRSRMNAQIGHRAGDFFRGSARPYSFIGVSK